MNSLFRAHHTAALTSEHPCSEAPPCHDTLYPYQRRLIHRMRLLETDTIEVQPQHLVCGSRVTRPETWVYELELGAMTDPSGTGKRETVCGLCALYPQGARPRRIPHTTTTLYIGRRTIVPALPEHPGRTLVIAPHTAVRAWVHALAKFPTLRSIALLHLPHRPIAWEELERLDVVVVSSRILRSFHHIFRDRTWGRVVIDECDTIDVPRFPSFLSHFTWLMTPRQDAIQAPRWEHETVLFDVHTPLNHVIRSSGYIRNAVETLQYATDPDHMLMRAFCVMTDPIVLEFERQEMERPVHVLSIAPNPQTMPLGALAELALKTHKEEGWKPVADQLGLSAMPLEDAMEQHISERSVESVRAQCETLCSVCDDDLSPPVLWPCCANVTCMSCALQIAKESKFHVRAIAPWIVRCPFCRSNASVQSWVVLEDQRRVPKETSSNPELDAILRRATRGKRMLVVLGHMYGGRNEFFTKALEACRKRNLRAEVLRGAVQTAWKRVDALAEGSLDVLFVPATYERGLDYVADTAIGVYMDFPTFEDMTRTIRCRNGSNTIYFAKPPADRTQRISEWEDIERVSLLSLASLMTMVPVGTQPFPEHTDSGEYDSFRIDFDDFSM